MKSIICLILLCIMIYLILNNQCSKPVSVDTFINAGDLSDPVIVDQANLPNVLSDALSVSDTFDDNYWVVKPDGYSDIYNNEDSGGQMINFMADIDRTTNITFKALPLTEQKNVPKPLETQGVPLELVENNEVYNLVGLAINEYYNQYYLLYESKPAPNSNVILGENLSYLNYHINSYLLAKMHDTKPEVLHNIGPRAKINLGDVVYLSSGTFQLGPLIIKSIKMLQK